MNIVIFLDIDGVLNIAAGHNITYLKTGEHMEKHLIENMNDFLTDFKNIKIVISSSWRSDMKDLEYQLKKNGFLFWDKRVIGNTKINEFLFRGEEIEDYVINNKIENYIILDDQLSDICGIMSNKIKKEKCLYISPEIGFDINKKNELVELIKNR